MSDIFKLIRANIERTRHTKEEQNEVSRPKSESMDLDSFIIGEEERKFQRNEQDKKRKSIEIKEPVDLFGEEIGSDYDSKNSLADLDYVDYVKLDKMPKDKQLRLMKKEYLVLKDRISEITGSFTKTDKQFKEQSVEYHSLKKEIARMKEFIRLLGHALPEGMAMKEKLEIPNWQVSDVEDEILTHLHFVVNRAKNAESYLEQETVTLTNQIQALKQKLTKVENRNLELEQDVQDLQDKLEQASFPQPDEEVEENEYYEESYEDDDLDYPSGENEDTEETESFDDVYTKEYGDAFDDEDEEEPAPPPKKTPPSPSRPQSSNRTERTNTSPPDSSDNRRPSQRDNRRPSDNKPNNHSEKRPQAHNNEQEEPRTRKEERGHEKKDHNRNREERPINRTRDREERPDNRNQRRERPEKPTPTSQQPIEREQDDRKRPSPIRNEEQRPSKPTPTKPTKPKKPTTTASETSHLTEVTDLKPALIRDDTFNPNQVMDVEAYIESLSDAAKHIITIVGELGVSRNAELKDILSTREDSKEYFFSGTKFQKNTMTSAVNDLVNAGILTNNQINLGARGSVFKIYELEELGKHLYFSLTNEVPVKSELSQLIRQHASAEHGFLIKDSSEIFHNMGYKVYTEQKDLRHDLEGEGSGKRKVFDLIIEKDGVKSYIEVERGTHTNEGFFKAMDKIRQITEEFYFICSNEEVLFNKTKRQFFMWIQKHLGGMDQAKGIKANFTTFGKLKEGKNPIWETIEL